MKKSIITISGRMEHKNMSNQAPFHSSPLKKKNNCNVSFFKHFTVRCFLGLLSSLISHGKGAKIRSMVFRWKLHLHSRIELLTAGWMGISTKGDPCGGFHGHGGTPIVGWFIMKRMRWGYPYFRKPPCVPNSSFASTRGYPRGILQNLPQTKSGKTEPSDRKKKLRQMGTDEHPMSAWKKVAKKMGTPTISWLITKFHIN